MIPGTAKRKRKHGGRRPGAGRKPLPEGHTTPVTVHLPAQHIAKVERWEEDHDAASFSDALRQIIDTTIP